MRTLFAQFLVISLSVSLPATVVFGQTTTTTSTIFQSNVDGIRIQIPNGWVVQDIDNTVITTSGPKPQKIKFDSK